MSWKAIKDLNQAELKERMAMIVANRRLVHKWIDDDMEFLRNALAGQMKAEEWIAALILSFAPDEIAECTPDSQFACFRDLTALMLLPKHRQAALIPRNITGKGRCLSWMPQWQGLKAMMMRSPMVVDVRPNLVHVIDKIEIEPTTLEVLTHERNPLDPRRVFRQLSDLLGGYVQILFRDGTCAYHFTHVDKIRKARDCAQSKDVWNAWFEEQCWKTLVRDVYSRQVVTIDALVAAKFQRLLDQEDQVLGNDPTRVLQPGRITKQRPTSLQHIMQGAGAQPALTYQEPVTFVHVPQEDMGELVPTGKSKKPKSSTKAHQKAKEEPNRQADPAPQPPADEPDQSGSLPEEAIAAIRGCTTREQLSAVYQQLWEQAGDDRELKGIVQAVCTQALQRLPARPSDGLFEKGSGTPD